MDVFSPIEISGLTLKNRAVLAPMVLNMATAEGAVTPALLDFILARARAELGYIVLGAAYVHPEGRSQPNQLGLHSDDLLPGLINLAVTVKPHSRLGIQLSYRSPGRLPDAFSLSEIAAIKQAFVQAARRALQAGFDAIELHACHEYWLNYFLSPHFNHRADRYGGGLDDRFRLLAEVVADIRRQVGRDILLGVRLNLDDFVEDGLRLEESLEIGRRLEELGVDYLSASVGLARTQYRMSPPAEVTRGSELVLARALQEAVRLPVMGVGRLDRPRYFLKAVAEGGVALVAAGRALIADPEYAAKIRQGRFEAIRPCLACNFCLACLHRGEAVRCAVNPDLGRELEEIEPLARPLKVAVAGGGPGGLTAAATAARRGARVTLFEAGTSWGGTLNLAKQAPFKEPIQDLIDFLVREARAAGVEMISGRALSPADLPGLDPEEVILATGARPIRPDLPGLDSGPVFTAEKMLVDPPADAGVDLIIGGGLVGLETALRLSEAGRDVTVVEMTDQPGQGLGQIRLRLILDRLKMAGVNLLLNTKVLAVENNMVRVRIGRVETRLGPFDALILAVGYQSDPAVKDWPSDRVPTTIVGDAREPRSIHEAISEGRRAALKLDG
ncbi:MAG: FAD-dependent oxidoreductase [Thermodesulfobacteriota bacterium]